ncbi:FmdB family zinc ribbon protein [Pelomicrobium methylotrophicum]|uniref:Zinc ribbon domain-containing protein n=1 Tax=Pelomicrobium methylotrophicum TaxID=2602750 RepID=A0A5C7EJA9_9PROT|nr:zinc ribbon domain-containing protein [Pelomicrobium methylotrophicum]TXF11049.1 zinc ribbon domain-containing protein [Pelomicrobium methylotrophicum]
MPIYDYDCPSCGVFETFRTLTARNDPTDCPNCGTASPRVFASAPRLTCLPGETRRAMEINERARHEPYSSGEYAYQRMRHPEGCSCCLSGKRSATVTAANGAKSFPARRPWMIGH